MLLIQYSFIKKYSDGMSYASTEYRNLNDFYYLIGIGMPFMTSVSLTPWEIAVKQTGNMILSIRKEFLIADIITGLLSSFI